MIDSPSSASDRPPAPRVSRRWQVAVIAFVAVLAAAIAVAAGPTLGAVQVHPR